MTLVLSLSAEYWLMSKVLYLKQLPNASKYILQSQHKYKNQDKK